MKTHTIELTPDELEMIVAGLRAFEDGHNCGTGDDEVYFPKVLALADKLANLTSNGVTK